MTAGNSTPLTDGASGVLLGSEQWARERSLPISAYLTYAREAAVDFVGGEGLLMAPVYAVPTMLARAGLTLQDFDFYEIHEAFASQVLATLAAWADDDFGKKRLGPAALKNGTELLATLDLEQGIFQGRTVDVPLLDSMLKSGDEASLLRCAQRLPDAALRTEAKRRVIQLHIQASPLPEVRANASALEERMMGGTNPVSLGEHPAVRAFVDLARSAQRSIVVEQDVLHRAGRLLGSASGRPGLSVLPEIPLSGVLQVESRTCAVQPEMRLTAKMGVKRSSGTPIW